MPTFIVELQRTPVQYAEFVVDGVPNVDQALDTVAEMPDGALMTDDRFHRDPYQDEVPAWTIVGVREVD